MKNLWVIIPAVAFLFTACPNVDDVNTVTVRFDDGAAVNFSITIGKGEAVGSAWPADPARLGCIFNGWYVGEVKYKADTVIINNVTIKAKWETAASGLEDQASQTDLADYFSTANGFPADLSNSWKIWGHRNPVLTQGFGADPSAMVYNDRLYLYMSNDTLLYNEGVVTNSSFSRGIQGIRILSSADLANWTDHGVINIAGPENTNPLIETWTPLITGFATASWAPSAVWKIIDGEPKFFLYWCNSGNGIGVVTADSPIGPWISPLDKLLIDRNTPNCADVEWLFDPGAFVDDDGSAYLFLGGGQNYTDPFNADDTGNARRVKLGADMISLDGVPETFYVPYLFEAMDMIKINNRYYLSYCTNWSTGGNRFSLQNSQIAYITAPNPMGSFGTPRGIMTTAASQLASGDTNNHQCIFEFKGEHYIAYHTQKPAQAMGLPGGSNYRTTSIDKITVNPNGIILPITMTRKGVEQKETLNPYIINEAETIGIMGGVYTRPDTVSGNGIVVTSIDTGDWLGVYGVDFGTVGAKKFSARVRTPELVDYIGAIELRLNPSGDGVTGDNGNLSSANTTRIKGGEVIGRVWIKAKIGEEGNYGTIIADLNRTVTGVHDLVFVFYSSLGVNPETINPDSRHKNGFEFDQWQFFRD